MTHIETDALMILALGEATPSSVEQRHLTECAACSTELAMLTRTVRIGRSAENTELIAPPADVWSRIQSELQLDSRPATAASEVPPASPPASPPAQRSQPSADAHLSPGSHVPTRKSMRPRRRARIWIPVAASALVVGLVGGVGAGIWWQSTRPMDSGIVVAGAELAPFPNWPDARGSAVVEQRADGTQQVVVDVDAATQDSAEEGGLREVWLIRRDGAGLVSIGFLNGTEGRFDVPAGIDLAQYPLVDISAEVDDGDPTHSGNSIVRGELGSI